MTPEDRLKALGGDRSLPTEEEWMRFRAKAHRSVARRRVAGVVGGAAVVVAVVVGFVVLSGEPARDQGGPEIAGTPTDSPAPSPTPAPSPSPTEAPHETVHLQQWFIENDKLMLFHSEVDKSQTPARAAMESLLLGVSGPLAEDGVETAIPEGTELLDVTIEERIATVDFNRAFEDSGHGSSYTQLQIAQVVFTLTQFSTVERVVIEVEGEVVGTQDRPFGTHGLLMEGPQTREDWHAHLPQIVVETPYAGEIIEGKRFIVAGIANVFEATVSWRLVDADGNVVQEGFTTATCGTGCWGTFEDEIRYQGNLRWVELQVFESSAEDGSPLHMMRLPINFAKRETGVKTEESTTS